MQEFFRPILFRFSSHRNFSARAEGAKPDKVRSWQPPTEDACLRRQQQQQRPEISAAERAVLEARPAMSSIFRGASAQQDSRFSDKAKKLLRTTKFPPNFDTKVDMKKVSLESLLPWITEQVTSLLGNDDDVVTGYIQVCPAPTSHLARPRLAVPGLRRAGAVLEGSPSLALTLTLVLIRARSSTTRLTLRRCSSPSPASSTSTLPASCAAAL